LLHFAILIPEISDETEFWIAPLNGIEKAELEIRSYGVKIEKFFFDQNDRSTFVSQTKKILKSEIDGVLLAPSFIEESIAFTTACRTKGIPYVLFNSDIPNHDSLCYIGPELFHSGYLAARLANYALRDSGKILVVNISRDIDNQHHLLRKEEGFRAYFKDHATNIEIIKTDIRQTDYESIAMELTLLFKQHTNLKAVFVTNSRVFSVARFLEVSKEKELLLIGFDFLDENIKYLKNGIIDFLICQKPQEQGYRGIMALYQHLILNEKIDKAYFMPIDIISKENYLFYRN